LKPLTPPNCDLRDFQFMPLDVVRLRDSELATTATGDEAFAAVLLWCAAWHQIPAGSLPNDDRQLSNFAGFGRAVGEWLKVREGALRGWVLCDDGRIYHPVVAEKARDAWQAKLERMHRTECARIKKAAQRTGTEAIFPPFEEWAASLGTAPIRPEGQPPHVPGDVPEKIEPAPGDVPRDTPPLSLVCPQGNGIQGTGIGTGTGREKKEAKAPAAPPVDFKADLFARWKLLPDGGGGAFLSKLLRDHKPEQRVLEAVERTLDETRADPKAFVMGLLRKDAKAADDYDQLMARVR
jgi:hypothetical protein